MKINPTAFNVGKTNGTVRSTELEAAAKAHEAEAAAAKAENKTDQVVLSSQGVQKAEINQLTRSIVSEIEKPAPPERLAAIAAAVKSGNYNVSTTDLVNSIMQRWMGF